MIKRLLAGMAAAGFVLLLSGCGDKIQDKPVTKSGNMPAPKLESPGGEGGTKGAAQTSD